jgi:hypothetical protein
VREPTVDKHTQHALFWRLPPLIEGGIHLR